jgi:hypothetical protein
LIPTECSESTVKVSSNKVCGKISIYPKKLTSWIYALIGKLKKVKINQTDTYTECLSEKKFENKIEKLKKKY